MLGLVTRLLAVAAALLAPAPGTVGALLGPPAWSPDDRLLAYSHGYDNGYGACPRIAWVAAGGGTPIRFRPDARTGCELDPVWAPSGRRFAILTLSARSRLPRVTVAALR